MRTDFDFRNSSLFGFVIFRPAFNTFERLNATQAWSLLFTAGREDKILGGNPKAGWRFTNSLFAIAASAIVGVIIFQARLLG